jgi:hypothetical protein
VSATLDNFTAAAPTPPVVLTAIEATTLDDLEQVIEKGIAAFIEVGAALTRIREGKLYRETHGTFEGYCRERWGIARGHAYRLIEATRVSEIVSPMGDTPAPASERVARELAPLKGDPEKLQETWAEVIEIHGRTPTAEQVREVVVGDHEVSGEALPERALPASREKLIIAVICHLSTAKDAAESIAGERLDDVERLSNFDRDDFLRELRDSRRAIGHLIARIEERREAKP